MIYLLAELQATTGNKELLKSQLLEMIEPTRQESGCLQYDLFEEENNEGHFIMNEIWENQESLDAHSNSKHMKEFIKNTEDTESLELLNARFFKK